MNGVTRGNKFRGYHKAHNFDNQQFICFKSLKSVYPFKLGPSANTYETFNRMKTNKLMELF